MKVGIVSPPAPKEAALSTLLKTNIALKGLTREGKVLVLRALLLFYGGESE